MKNSLFRRRRREHKHDETIRESTIAVIGDHRRSLSKVRKTLRVADATLAQEIQRLDDILEGRATS